MSFRNSLFRTVLLLALALAVAIAVAISSGGDRTRTTRGSSLPAVEHQSHQRFAEPLVRPPSHSPCALHEECLRL